MTKLKNISRLDDLEKWANTTETALNRLTDRVSKLEEQLQSISELEQAVDVLQRWVLEKGEGRCPKY